MAKICERCNEPCESCEVETDDSFHYEYGAESRTHYCIGIEVLSDCCKAEMRDSEDVYSDYLLELRDSGCTNMFGATPFLMDKFGLKFESARDILVHWMSTFNSKKGENDGE